jgi:hypothetical protein
MIPGVVEESDAVGTRLMLQTPEKSMLDLVKPEDCPFYLSPATLGENDPTLYRVTPFLQFGKHSGVLEVFINSAWYYKATLNGRELVNLDFKGMSLRAEPDF